MARSAGFCGSIFICLLVLINTFFFLLGASFFTVGAIVKWTGPFGDIKKEVLQIVTELKLIDSLTNIFLIVGGAIMLVSLIGFVGACCRSRFFLIMYEIVITLVFIGHLAGFVYTLAKGSEINEGIKKDLNRYVNNLISEFVPSAIPYCQAYKKTADFLQCCDFNTTYPSLRTSCCPIETRIRETCIEKLTYMNYFLLITLPNSIILGFEFIIILAVFYLIVRFKKTPEYANENKKYLTYPTTYEEQIIRNKY